MYALKLVGLVVLASISALGFIAGYGQFQDYQAHLDAQDAVEDIDYAVKNNFFIGGNPQENFELEVEVPSGHELIFEENSVSIDGITESLEGKGQYSYVENSFSAGFYNLRFSLYEDNDEYLIEVREV